MRKFGTAQLTLLIAAIIISFGILVSCKEQNVALRPSTVIAQQTSHNGILTAVILKYGGDRTYRFGIRSKDGTLSVIDQAFVPEAGYHEPIFKLTWSKKDDRVFVVVDHDFGDGNLKFVFNVKSFSWKIIDE